MDQFAKEVQQNEYSQFSAVDETNKFILVFNKYLLSLDWDNDLQTLYSFDSWIDRFFSVNIVAPLKNNHKVALLSKQTKQVYLLTRQFPSEFLESRGKHTTEMRVRETYDILSFEQEAPKQDGFFANFFEMGSEF